MELLSVHTASEWLKKPDNCLIDVRSPAEFAATHAIGAINIPLDQLSAERVRAAAPQAKKILFICQRGGRSKNACERLEALGLSDVYSVEGGTESWDGAHLPVARGAPAMSLERQVRIVAGALVLLGAIVGLTVSPHGMFLSAFVGAGLVFAGITDRCGMALLLGRMPWNQCSNR